jgi:SAM-dependent methyltransferase
VNERASRLERQRRFYESRAHEHLRPRRDDHYSEKLVARLAHALGMESHHRVCEIGASFGRFTIPLLGHCHSLLAVDVSERALGELARTRDALGIPEGRCRVHVADARDLTLDAIAEPVDFVVGFFILHHLDDLPGTIRSLSRLVRAGGGLAFLEPNRRNPLFLAQLIACRDMRWGEEKGLFTLSARGVAGAYRAAGLSADPALRLGFFPPQVVNRIAWLRRLEERLERSRLLAPFLPFLLMTAGKGGGTDPSQVGPPRG